MQQSEVDATVSGGTPGSTSVAPLARAGLRQTRCDQPWHQRVDAGVGRVPANLLASVSLPLIGANVRIDAHAACARSSIDPAWRPVIVLPTDPGNPLHCALQSSRGWFIQRRVAPSVLEAGATA